MNAHTDIMSRYIVFPAEEFLLGIYLQIYAFRTVYTMPFFFIGENGNATLRCLHLVFIGINRMRDFGLTRAWGRLKGNQDSGHLSHDTPGFHVSFLYLARMKSYSGQICPDECAWIK